MAFVRCTELSCSTCCVDESMRTTARFQWSSVSSRNKQCWSSDPRPRFECRQSCHHTKKGRLEISCWSFALYRVIVGHPVCIDLSVLTRDHVCRAHSVRIAVLWPIDDSLVVGMRLCGRICVPIVPLST